jgi:hypothetical protein
VSIIDPVPLKYTWSWDSTQQWPLNNQNQIGTSIQNPLWSESLGSFIVTDGTINKSLTSTDGVNWTTISSNLQITVCSPSGVFLSAQADGIYRSTDTVSWTRTSTVTTTYRYYFVNNLFILITYDDPVLFYTSPDGITWTIKTSNLSYSPGLGLSYGNSKYILPVGDPGYLYTSTDLITWTAINSSNVTSNPYGWISTTFEPQSNTFVALRYYTGIYISSIPKFVVQSMTPQPTIDTPLYNATSITYTGFWLYGASASLGDKMYFTGSVGPPMYFSPATYGTITSVNSSTVTISLISSTVTVQVNSLPSLLLFLTPTQTQYTIINSSDGGITWYGRDTPVTSYLSWSVLITGGGKVIAINRNTGVEMLYSSDGGTTWGLTAGTLGPIDGVYSPKLEYFMFVDSSISYLSLDGQYIVPALQNITYGSIRDFVWADTLGLIVAITNSPSIITSSDGKTWNAVINVLTDGSRNGGGSLLWSKELGVLVAYISYYSTSKPNKYSIYTSNDGINWSLQYTDQTYPGFRPILCWSPQLGLFTTGSKISRDGLNWTSGAGPSLVCAAWSSYLKLFVGSDSSKTYYSRDGLTWTEIPGAPVFLNITWSQTLKIFVGGANIDYIMNIFTSINGTNWTNVYTGNNGESINTRSLTWSPELNLFIIGYNNSYIMTSKNGTSWTKNNTISWYGNDNGNITWITELKSFLTTAHRSNYATKTF